jgi:alanine racemase
MDITLIDVTAVADVKVGDPVILLSSSDHCGRLGPRRSRKHNSL